VAHATGQLSRLVEGDGSRHTCHPSSRPARGTQHDLLPISVCGFSQRCQSSAKLRTTTRRVALASIAQNRLPQAATLSKDSLCTQQCTIGGVAQIDKSTAWTTARRRRRARCRSAVVLSPEFVVQRQKRAPAQLRLGGNFAPTDATPNWPVRSNFQRSTDCFAVDSFSRSGTQHFIQVSASHS
jgi:hypothetical protein